MGIDEVVRVVGTFVELVGVGVIVLGAVAATVAFARDLRGGTEWKRTYHSYRLGLARAILLGLEFLVAGDIIRTVVVDLTFHSLGLLAVLVAIRTFLSISIEVEVEGRVPWRRENGGG